MPAVKARMENAVVPLVSVLGRRRCNRDHSGVRTQADTWNAEAPAAEAQVFLAALQTTRRATSGPRRAAAAIARRLTTPQRALYA